MFPSRAKPAIIPSYLLYHAGLPAHMLQEAGAHHQLQ